MRSTQRKCTWLISLVAATWLADGRSTARSETRPNVVFILVDDLGAHDLGCYGSRFHETPNLDRLAREGMRFEQAYAACPVCSPTRAALLTGKYPPRTGITDFIGGKRAGKLKPADYSHQLALDEVTLAKAFREAGYKTGLGGKWHLGGPGFMPKQHGFDEAEPDTGDHGWKQEVDRGDRVTDFAIRFLDAHRSQPFFLYLPHNLVHTPLTTKRQLQAKYEKKAAALPKLADDDRFRPEGERKDRRVQDHAVYAAMMEDLDTQVGRVLAKLDELGLRDKTIVVFTSDNGGLSTSEGSPTSNAPLRAGKGWLYEGGIRVPAIVRFPGMVKPGSSCRAPTITTDWFPTLLDLCALPLKPGQHLDGVNLAPALRSGPDPAARPLFWHYPHYGNQGGTPGGAIRDGKWKLIESFESGHVSLFDLSHDPGEQIDLSAKHPDKARDLLSQLSHWRTTVGAKMPVANPDPPRTSGPPKKRNVLFIAVDDLKPALACAGDPFAQTPNIDKLAANGTVFTRAYCQQAVCSPSRSSLLTGRRPDTTRVFDLVTHFRTALPDVVTLPQHFKANGYYAHGIGKIYHGGYNDDPSWSVPWEATKGRAYGPDGQKLLRKRKAKAKANEEDLQRVRGMPFEAPDVADDYLNDGWTANRAIEILKSRKGRSEPFFLAVGFAKPHLPFVAPMKYWDLYDATKLPVADSANPPLNAPKYAPQFGGELRAYHDIPKNGPVPKEMARQLVHGYYAVS